MHNSNNSAVGKVIFTGAHPAQSRPLGITADTNNPSPNELSKVELELLAKADGYQIPYNKKCIDRSDLEDKICEFESLIKEADEMFIDWEEFGYDPIGIEQAIIDLSEQNFKNQMVERVYGAGIEYYG